MEVVQLHLYALLFLCTDCALLADLIAGYISMGFVAVDWKKKTQILLLLLLRIQYHSEQTIVWYEF